MRNKTVCLVQKGTSALKCVLLFLSTLFVENTFRSDKYLAT